MFILTQQPEVGEVVFGLPAEAGRFRRAGIPGGRLRH